jgi:hypothetical protein
MSRQRDHIIECFKAVWKIANQSLRLFVENLEKDRSVGSIFGNQFHFLLMQHSHCLLVTPIYSLIISFR